MSTAARIIMDSDTPPSGASSGIWRSASSRYLLRLARGGDRQALDRLFARHLPRLYRWTRRRLPHWVRDVADTADLVQDTLLRALGQMDHFEPVRPDALQAYLRQAVTNRIRDEHRRAERRQPVTSLDEHRFTAPPEDSPLEAAIGAETAAAYAAALTRLRFEEQQAIVARVEMRYSYAQIALILGKPTPDAARMAVSRALVRLAKEMGCEH